MRSISLLAAALLALPTARAAAVPIAQFTQFFYTGGPQSYTVPDAGAYTIIADGAQGGDSNFGFLGLGGRGAEVRGDFALAAGEVLIIDVGGRGSAGGAGSGGGGTFVVAPNNTPLLIAGGGGGAKPRLL